MSDCLDKNMAIDAVQRIEPIAILKDGDVAIRLSAVEHVLCNLPTTQQPNWTPVTVGLPNDDEDVLVTSDAGDMMNIEIDSMGSDEDGSERFWWNSQNPVAWMPLPEPYKEEINGH